MSVAVLPPLQCEVAIVGAGPAGLMAAEQLSARGVSVHVFDGKASVGRKFLLAGKGGLNLTHSEAFERFVERYGESQPMLQPLLQDFGADQLRAWADGLGIGTFVGTSGRVFPTEMKAAPLLRTWLARLRAQGVVFHMRHLWKGWDDAKHLLMETPAGVQPVQAKATLLALGGGSWARLGSDGSWVPLLQAKGDQGWDYFDALNNNIAYYGKRGSDPKNKVSSGEFAVSISYIDASIEQAAEENDLTIVYPSDGMPWVPEGVSVFKNAENVDAAKYFVEWLFSSDDHLRQLAEIEQKNGIKVIKPSIEGIELSYDPTLLMTEDLSLFGSQRTEILDRFEPLMGDKAAAE